MTRLRFASLACLVAGCTAGAAPPGSAGHAPVLAPADLRPAPAPDGAAEPTGTVTLADALALALLRHPTLAAHSWQVRAAEARRIQAGARPNAEASFVVEDVLGSGPFRDGREAQLTLELGQTIELGGRRAARVAAAAGSHALAGRDYELARVEALSEVTRRFVQLLAAQRLIALAEADVRVGEQTLAATRRRGGAGSPLDEPKARIELARARIAAEHAEHELLVARRELAATWGSATPRFTAAAGDLFARRPLPSYETVTARLAEAPELLRHLSEREVRAAEVRLADAMAVPSPRVAAGVRRFEGPDEHAFVFGVSVPLPTGDRNRGGRAEARALLAKSEAGLAGAEVRLRTVLFALHQELRHAVTALEAIEAEILPQAEATLELSRRGFGEGRFSYLELADAQRTVSAVERERIETATQYHRLVLEIERLTGAPLDAAPRAEAP